MYIYIYIYIHCAVLWCAQIIEYIVPWWAYTVICTLHCLIIIIMQTYLKVLNCWNSCQIYSVTSVCLRLGRFSQLYFMQYMGLCVFSLSTSLTVIVRTPVLDLIIIIKSEVWYICHCLWVRLRNHGTRCMSFYILILIDSYGHYEMH